MNFCNILFNFIIFDKFNGGPNIYYGRNLPYPVNCKQGGICFEFLRLQICGKAGLESRYADEGVQFFFFFK